MNPFYLHNFENEIHKAENIDTAATITIHRAVSLILSKSVFPFTYISLKVRLIMFKVKT